MVHQNTSAPLTGPPEVPLEQAATSGNTDDSIIIIGSPKLLKKTLPLPRKVQAQQIAQPQQFPSELGRIGITLFFFMGMSSGGSEGGALPVESIWDNAMVGVEGQPPKYFITASELMYEIQNKELIDQSGGFIWLPISLLLY